MNMPDPSPGAVLTPTERAALERLLVSQKRGGEGWHRESSAAAQVRDILEAGATVSERDERLLEKALRMAEGRT